MKASSARLMLMEQLASDHVHYTAEELFTNLKSALPGLSLATVYKNLEDLSQAGLIREIRLNGQNRRFELDRGDHIHLISGKKIQDISDSTLMNELKERLTQKIGPDFDIESIEIQIFGNQKKIQLK
ncbi:MAG TPA: transcriptional repressor [Catalimonadaceae bacterium]|nr:transcriptional repressor [Catalimonadaceae bacterium]